MNKKVKTTLKLIVIVVIIALFVWFVFIWPTYTFKKNEQTLEDAAKRYFELNQTELPTGTRIATVDMQTLYHKAYLKEDFYIPYTDEPCSLKESWVKVKKETNGEYKYYTYLKCGALESTVDSKGPEITLNGSDTVTVDLGEEYKDAGVKSVVDNTFGKMEVSDVTIKTSEVDTSKIGEYKVTYTAYDELKNKTTVTRTVKVVSKIKNAVSKITGETGYYTGKNPNNYIRLSGMMFRIIGIDGDNVRIVAEEDIANVNYDGIESWLDYYYEHITDAAKKLLVKNKYCNMTISDTTLETSECTSFTKERYVYIPSATDINKTKDTTGSFMKPETLSWLANPKDTTKAYATRNVMFGNLAGYDFYSDEKVKNYGVRPVLTIKGTSLLTAGNGTYENPYTFGETKTAKTDDLVNTRYTGEYISYSGVLWRIIGVNSDGTTKIISCQNIKQDGVNVKTNYTETTSTTKIYNPTEKNNVGYYINNKISEFIDTSYFVNKNVSVPIYKNEIQYGQETSTKKYKVKLSAPNMYEMFSAHSTSAENMKSYWLINSSKTEYKGGAVSDAGVTLNTISEFDSFGVRVVANLNSKVLITKGHGTLENPYNITK